MISTLKNLNSHITLPTLGFIIGFIYCSGLILTSGIFQNISTIFLILAFIIIFYKNMSSLINDPNKSPIWVFVQIIFIHLGIASAAYFFKSPVSFFWVPDSIGTHIPEAIKFSNFFKGESVQELGKFPGILTHSTTGLLFNIFGINVFSSILAQLIFKSISMICTYELSKLLWNRGTALCSMLIIGLCPTLFFYNLVTYKESAVQSLVALLLLSVLKIFIERKKLFIFPMLLTLGLLTEERFYIFYLFIPTIIFFLIRKIIDNKRNYKILIGIMSLLLLIIVSWIFRNTIFEISRRVHNARIENSHYSDVMNKFNYDIPYIIALLKITFSPYFTINKFKIFSDTSLLLIWGSPFNQVIIMLSLFGLFKSVKQNLFHVFIWTPFFIFLIFAAYVSPWSGRLRDSFYTIIACYAGYYLYEKFLKTRFT